MNIVRNLFKRLAARDTRESPTAATPAPLLRALEPRIVYDASVAAVGTAHHHADTASHGNVARPTLERAHELPAAVDNEGSGSRNTTWARNFAQSSRDGGAQGSQVVFIDPAVTNYQELISGLPTGTRYVVLSHATDGLAQIAQYLEQHPGVESIHLVSHGADGEIQVGSTWLNAGDLAKHSAELTQIGAAMKPGGDFLIYGCDVAENADGKALVQQIASISHLNVAASTDATGAAALGGNWTLEYQAGHVHTPVIFSATAEQHYGYLLAQTIETYTSAAATSLLTSDVTSFTLDGITYTYNIANSTTTAPDSNLQSLGDENGSDYSLEVNQDGVIGLASVTIRMADGKNFKMSSLDVDASADTNLTIEANGSPAGAINYVSNGLYVTQTVDLTTHAAFNSVSSITISGPNLLINLGHLVYQEINPPVVTTTGGATTFTSVDSRAGTRVAVDAGITLSDVEATTMAGATVAITGNLHAGEDVLAFTNTNSVTYGAISGSYSAGTLTLSGAGTTAQYQAALAAVTYLDTSATPNTTARTITFSANDGLAASSLATKTVNVDSPPIVSTTGGVTTVFSGGSGTAIDSGITVTDPSQATQASATVSIGAGFHSGDALAFTNTSASQYGDIAGTYNAGTGVLTLSSSSATATDAQWTHALEAVTFSSSSTTYGNRTVSFAVNDGSANGVAASKTVGLLNGGPVLTVDGGSAAFVAGDDQGSTPVAIDPGLTVSAPLAPTLSSATVAITGGFQHSEDRLLFFNSGSSMGNIAGSYNAMTGVLTLTSSGSTATMAQWQSALEAVVYTDIAATPNNATRTMSFSATDSLGNASATVSRTMTVTDTDQTPILSVTSGTTNYVGASSGVIIDGSVLVNDYDNATQASGTVAITSGFHSGDTLSFTNDGSMGNIAASYNAATGVLTLTSAGATASLSQWSMALSAVTFSSTSTTYGNRTISFATSDGAKTSIPKTDTITITAPPVITTDAGSASFVAGDNVASAPVTIDSGLTVTDGSATTLVSATVAITGNFHAGEDILAFTNNGATMGNIAASYNAGTGVLTLSSAGATATLAQWQSALGSVTYTDTAVTPNNATRTMSFTAVDSGGNTSAAATRTVTVADTDQTPIVTSTGGTTSYAGASSPVTIDGGITVSDLDNATQASATVQISSGFHAGDMLGFINTGSITGSYNAGTGVLTLTSSGATATNAQWASVLSSVTFSSSSSTYGNRTIQFSTNDGVKSSAPVSDTVNITAPPTITTDAGSTAFTAGDNVTSTPVAIDAGLRVTDGSATTLASATVAITGNFHSGEDLLSFVNTNSTTFGNIAASYNATTGVLTLTSSGASATLAQWQSALESVTYTDTAITPNNATRTLSFSSVDSAANVSNTATRTVTVADTDQTPVVATTGGITNYVGGTSAVIIDGGISVTDRDNTTQSSGMVSIIAGFHSGDTLSFSNTSSTQFGNIQGFYNAATGVLTLTSSGATSSDAQWANAFKAITFSAGSSAMPGNRTIAFVVNDGAENSAAATDTVSVLGPPQITTDAGSASFVAGDNVTSTPVAIDSGLTVTDGAASTLASATVAITGNFHPGEDVLRFSNNGVTMGNITASYNAATGVMTLTSAGATATLAQWQAALDSVTYTDTAITPNNATRTISFTAADGGGVTSNTATRTVTIADTDQTPVVTTTGGTMNYVGGTGAAIIDGGISVTDRDNTTQSSATVSITTGFHSGDTLSFTNTSSALFGNIVASYNSGTGVLTLVSAGATSSDAQWTNALDAVTFSAAASATPGNRTMAFVVNDGIKNSVAATDTVSILGPPQITTDAGSASFVAGNNVASTPVAIDSGLTVTDGAASTLASATVMITGNFQPGEDVLRFSNNGSTMGNIGATYNAATGVLTLTSAGATATLAQWQSALESVTYTDTAITPNNATRTIGFTAVDSGGSYSNTATRLVTVADVDQTPIVSTTGGTTNYVGGTSARVIDGGISVTDLDNMTQASGTVSITAGFQISDTLSFTNTSSMVFGNIVASYNSGTGVLTLTSSGATSTDAQWANAFRAVTFSAASWAIPGNRTIAFVVNDGTQNSVAATDTVSVLGPPQITTDLGSAAFVAGDNVASTPVAIDAGLTVTDGAASTLASATVAITGNFHPGEDVLLFTNNGATMGNIAASYSAGTGVLTLTSAGASATLAQWQSALESVTYTDTAITPNPVTRTISFTATDALATTSNIATRTVTVADVDQTPIVSTTGGTTNYVGGTRAGIIDGNISVTDLDNTTQASGTVSIATGFHSGDTLSFTNTSSSLFGNIVASYNAGTGVLTLTSSGATSSDAQWANALRAVTFSAASSATPGNRTIAFVVNDGMKSSAAATDTVSVLGPPQVTTDAGSSAFVAGDNVTSTPVLIDAGVALMDGASSTFAAATVGITGNFHPGEDVLSFVNNGATMGNITASYNASTGVLTLTSAGATATLAQWQSALESVTYTDTAITPNNATRTISFTAVDGGGNISNTATRTVTVTDTDQTPIVTTTGGTNYVGHTAPVTIDHGITVSDRDNTTLPSATISISGGFQSGDMLTFGSGSTGPFLGNYVLATGVMTVTPTSPATLAQWQSLLDNLQFSSSSTVYGQRTISIVVSDGTKTSIVATDTVNVLAPPVIRTDAGSAAFVAGDNTASTPVVIDGGLAITDGASATMASGTVAITGNFHAGEDVLSFVNDGATMGNIAASYNATTGVMTLTSAGGTATLAQWRAAFESVTYTDTAITPNTATRTISFTAVDGGGNASNTAARTVTVADTDQTPIVTTSGGHASFVAGDNTASTPVTIDPGISLSDRDNTTLASATVAISGNFRAGQDVLAFANDGTMGNITASYDAATGIMTLTSAGGMATVAQWQAALKSVTYTDTAITPDTATRTISFSVNDGTKTSVAGTRTVTVADTDQTPVVTTTSGGAVFVAGDNTASTPVAIDASIALSDRDNTTLASAAVAISGNFRAGQDVLAFANDGATMGNITASYNAATGVLTLSSAGGTATLTQWQAALKSVTYTDTAITPDTATRTISFSVNDGTKTSAVATRTMTVVDTDQTPIVTTSGGNASFVAADNTTSTPVAVDPGIALSDRDNTTLASATVAVTGNFHAGEDVLAFANDGTTMGNISASYNAATGVLTLSSAGGAATLAQWQAALKSVTYTDTAITPDTATRTISFSVNDGMKTSTAASRAVSVADTDQTPIVTTSSGAAVFGGPGVTTPVAIDPNIAVADRDNTTLASATVSIVAGFHPGEDVLAFTNNGTTMGNITGAYNAATGVLTLSSAGGTATLAQWQAALASVSYADTNVANDAGSRTIAFVVNDGTLNSVAVTRAITVNAGFAGQVGQFGGTSSTFITPVETRAGSDIGSGEPVVLNALAEPTLLSLSSPVLRTVTFTAPDASRGHIYDAQGGTRVDSGMRALPDAIPAPFNIPVTIEHRDVAAGAKFTVALDSLAGGNERIVSVTQANGRALPAWLSYDAATGALRGHAPAHGAKPYELRLMVGMVDQAGHQTYREVVLDFGKGGTHAALHPVTPSAPQAMAKPSLTEQFARERHALHVAAMAPARPSAPARHI